jgi:hypothetical protein
MGLLDDAIREHLELKRRRGADPDEVARQQDEALGDPRSGEFAQPDAVPEPGEEPVVPPVAEEELPPEPPAPAAYEPEAEPEPEPEPPAEREPEPWLADDDRVDAGTGQPTAEFTPPDVEPEHDIVRPDDEPGGDEDVLEETPDFLQETPEHDRLWFEQKPPRDFDFDS